MAEKIKIIDTTLRDGLQAPGIYLSFRQRIEIAKLLKLSGITEIEAGIPATGEDEREYLKNLVDTLQDENFTVLTWNRGKIEDIKHSINCGITAVNISFPVSDIMIEKKLNKNRNWIVDNLKKCVSFAKKHNLFVSIGCEDATRADVLFLIKFIKTAELMGADRIRIADTTGCSHPSSFRLLIERVKANTLLPVEVHTHNDFGLATANSIAGVEAGAEAVSVTINGIGERAGNASLEEVVASLHLLLKKNTGINLKMLKKLSSTVSVFTGKPIPENKPIVGKNVFTHKSGIHIDGILKKSENYVYLNPELLDRENRFYIGYYSGLKTLEKLVKKTGINLEPEKIKKLHELLFETGKSFTIDELKSFILKQKNWSRIENEKRGTAESDNEPYLQHCQNYKCI